MFYCLLLLTYCIHIYIHLSSTIEINFIQEASSKTTAAQLTTGFGQFVFSVSVSVSISVSFYAFGCEFLLPIELIEWSGATGDGNGNGNASASAS